MNTGNLNYHWARLNIAEKFIAINVVVFLLDSLLRFFFRLGENAFSQYLALPKDFFEFLLQPWTLITYAFMHYGIWHLFWNMVMLYFASRIFLNLFDTRRWVNVYFLGIITGALFFMLSYNLFPVFAGVRSYMMGASAGVTAVLIFICAYIPNQEVRVFFFNLKLWYIGVFFVLMDLIQIPVSGNAGGHIAHLGGALLGYIYARQLLQGKDIGDGFSQMVDATGSLFKKRERKGPLKTVYKKSAKKSTATAAGKPDYDKAARQRKIDSILDKISKSGYESLSKAEKDFLFKAGKED